MNFMELYLINLLVYQAFLIPVVFFSIVYLIAAISTILTKSFSKNYRKLKNSEWPKVTIQIPVFNDPVAVRCVQKCIQFDYPKDKFEIIIADDSSGKKTLKILDEFLKTCQENVKLV